MEDIFHGRVPEPEHLGECEQCKNRLNERKALAGRLRRAFSSVKPGADLVKAIRSQFGYDSTTHVRRFVFKGIFEKHINRILMPAAAAMILLMISIFGIYSLQPDPAMAAKAQLIKIHEHNLSPGKEFHAEAEPAKLAAYFKDKLGFSPTIPKLGSGMSLRGCCVRHFNEEIVGSYVVDTPKGVMSMIIVTDSPESLGMAEKAQMDGQVIWKSSFAKCNMVTVRLGGYSYCAVGEISYDYLIDLLSRLMM